MTPTGAPLDRPTSDPEDRAIARSATSASRSDAPELLPIPGSTLSRAATTINVVSLEERQDRLQAAAAAAAATDNVGPMRSDTMSKPAGMTRGLSIRTPPAGLSVRALGPDLSVRTPGGSLSMRTPGADPSSRTPGGSLAVRTPSVRTPGTGRNLPARPTEDSPNQNSSRLTEIYDDYIAGYANEEPPEVPPLPAQLGDDNRRVAAWARNNANPSVRRAPSSASPYGPPPSAYSSNYPGGSVRRKLSRRPTYGARSAGSGARSTVYDDEEEGYVSGDYDDGPFELVKIRVKASGPFILDRSRRSDWLCSCTTRMICEEWL